MGDKRGSDTSVRCTGTAWFPGAASDFNTYEVGTRSGATYEVHGNSRGEAIERAYDGDGKRVSD